ncbi:MAG TPA: hypothetical protein PKJ69_08190, partial [Spirochaetota bacterium]|nr:hypothetical protein [Spirochaetota bacterium]
PQEATLQKVQKLYPSWMSASHPLDLWPAIEQNGSEKVYTSVAKALMEDERVDSIIIECFATQHSDPSFWGEIGNMAKQSKKPVLAWAVGEKIMVEQYKKHAEASGIPFFGEIGRCVQIFKALRFHFNKRGSI